MKSLRVGESILTATGYVTKALALHRWKRPDGLTSFLADMIALRKTLCLCKSCEYLMPRRWREKYGYDFVRGYSAECAPCSRCRKDDSTNMYVATEGRYGVQLAEERRVLGALKERERQRLLSDKRYLVGTSHE